jgi:dihydrofolate synthase/folylpolyglutamate synthase
LSQSALDYLFGLERLGIKFGLENMTTIVDALGHPERSYPTIHVAGTNGKGSVAAMVDAGLRAAGFHSGRYTSPHLVDVHERFVIDGRPLEPERLEAAVNHLRSLVAGLIANGRLGAQPTFFEVTTAIAFEVFRSAAVNVAVCEVGMGGRLDATNVLTPLVTAITSIGHDHQQYLGNSLGEIAIEKAGIIKPGIPVILGRLDPASAAVIATVAGDRGAPCIDAAQGATVVDDGIGETGGLRIRVRTPRRDYGPIDLALAGAHQIDNALVAVRILEAVDERGLPVPLEAVRRGLSSVRWPGRLDRRILPDGRDVLLDAAHNLEGAAALARFLGAEGGSPRVLIFTAMADKDISNMLGALMPQVKALVVTRAANPRSADPHELARVAREVNPTIPVYVEPLLPEALDAAWRLSPRIAIAGSIFLLGDVMKCLGWS